MSNDISGTITAANTPQVLIEARQTSAGFCVQNLDATENLWINDEGGAAVIGPGSICIPPRSLYETPDAWATQAAFQSVSVISAKAGHAFTARRW